jgi:hypothetical protein
MQKLIINKALGNSIAEPTNGIDLKAGDSIVVSGLAGSEVAGLYVRVGNAFVAVRDNSGTAIELTATKTAVTISGAGTYQVQCGTTAGAVTISINIP